MSLNFYVLVPLMRLYILLVHRDPVICLFTFFFFFIYRFFFSLLTSPGTYLQARRDQKDYGNSS